MVGSRRMHLDDGNTDSSNKRLKLGNDSSVVAANPIDHNAVNHEALVPCSSHSLSTAQEPPNKLMAATSIKRKMGPPDVEEASHAVLNEELNQNRPQIKRQKLEGGGESSACKRCNCKKSKCLKLYCECFAAGVFCAELCSCIECFNKPTHEEIVLTTRTLIQSHNPYAFAPVSARHIRGCNCKKSGCLKKYCECYQGGVGCSLNCRCEGCKNAFGRKNGSEAGLEGEKREECEISVVDRASQKAVMSYDAESIESAQQGTLLPFASSEIQIRDSGLHEMRSFDNLIQPSNSKRVYSSHGEVGSSEESKKRQKTDI